MNEQRKIIFVRSWLLWGLMIFALGASNVVAQTCGNGVVEAGEQCDDGGTSGGCCTAQCTFAAAQTACYDGNPNTTDSCNAAGVCVGVYQTTTCGACRNPNDQSDTSYCDLTTNQCVRQTSTCAPFEVQNGTPNMCRVFRSKDPTTGVCAYQDKICARSGCFATDCNPTNGQCELSGTEDPRNIRCRGSDDFCRTRDGCGEVTPCRYRQCDPRGTATNCGNVVEINCFAENTNSCLTPRSSSPAEGINNGCQEGVGCVFTVQACAQPTNSCEVLVRDGNAEGCCTYQPRDCAAEFGNNPNYTYACDPNAANGVCQATIKPEQCNGADDNGNGQVDEGFPNTDGDALANCVDADDDNDLQTDADENACGSNPLVASSKSLDTDNDNRPNCVDTDDDNDGVLDVSDNCPLNANPDQRDADGDGAGDVCDATPNPPPAVQIVFSSTRDSAANSVNSEIYGMRADGTGVVRLTNNPAQDIAPALSPDKSKILFTSTRDNNRTEIFVMNANGSNVQRLTINSVIEGIANWSPTGAQIVFTSKRDGNAEIYAMNADGTNVRRLTNHAKTDFNPVWSPDGTKIAFASNRTADNFEIYTMNAADGGNVVRLTNNAAEDLFPTFSPDAAKIAFTSTRNSNVEIYSMNAASGANVVRLTNNSAIDAEPSWGANNRIAFTSTRDGRTKIFVMNADGGTVSQLTDNATGYDLSPDW